MNLARRNAEINGLTQVVFERADVFDKLGALAEVGDHFGLIVLDPPKFAAPAMPWMMPCAATDAYKPSRSDCSMLMAFS